MVFDISVNCPLFGKYRFEFLSALCGKYCALLLHGGIKFYIFKILQFDCNIRQTILFSHTAVNNCISEKTGHLTKFSKYYGSNYFKAETCIHDSAFSRLVCENY